VKLYLKADLERFLKGVDAELSRRTEVVVIGGAAAAIQYRFEGATRDVDTWTGVQKELADAVKRAHRQTDLEIPLRHSGVADGPHNFESRLERALPRLRRLIVKVPEKHDLVLMKVVRGYEHDLEAIEGIHAYSPLDLATLVHRFQTEMGSVIGSPTRIRGQFLTMIERLFPDELEAVEERLARPAARSRRRKSQR
jgi:hypothetical protein